LGGSPLQTENGAVKESLKPSQSSFHAGDGEEADGDEAACD
jgi:hypothetical protein